MAFLKNFFHPFILIFIIAFLVRFGFLIWNSKVSYNPSPRPYIPVSDQRIYDSLAYSFLGGYGLNWSDIFMAHYPPFYPIFLSFLYSFFGHFYYSYFAVFLVQVILSSLCPVFVFWIGKKIFNPSVGFIAALITVFYLPFIRVVQDLHLENLLIFMPLLFIAILINVNDKSSFQKKIMAGIIMGLTILTKPIFLFILTIFTFLWLKINLVKNRFFPTFLTVLVVSLFFLSLWIFRNFLLFKRFVFSSQFGPAIYTATNFKYQQYNRLAAREIIWHNTHLNEAQMNSLLFTQGIKNIFNNPGQNIIRIFNNLPDFFPPKFSNLWLILILSFAFSGFLITFFKKNNKPITFALLFFLFIFQYAFFWVYPRFRLPFDWILIIFVAHTLYLLSHYLWKKFCRQKQRLIKFLVQPLIINKSLLKYLSVFSIILVLWFLGKLFMAYILPRPPVLVKVPSSKLQHVILEKQLAKQWQLQNEQSTPLQVIEEYQKKNQGDITPFLNKIVYWSGEINYINRNAIYPLGNAEYPYLNDTPEYKDFYDINFQPSTTYSTFDLIVNRGIKPRYYGDGIVMVNYPGLLNFNYANGNQVTVVAKIIGQNYLGQIYLGAYEIFK